MGVLFESIWKSHNVCHKLKSKNIHREQVQMNQFQDVGLNLD